MVVANNVVEAFEKGYVLIDDAKADAEATVPRPELLKKLQELLRPASIQTYAIVLGASGMGKVRVGIILVGFTCSAKHGRPMTLVIDDVQKLAREKPQFRLKLQEFAKDCADGGHLRVVLVSSDLTVLTFLQDNTSMYRCKRPLEVGESDISAAAAVEYLLARLTKEDAEDKWERTDSNKALACAFLAAASYRCCALLALLSMSLRLHRAAEPRGERLQHHGEGSGMGAGAAPED